MYVSHWVHISDPPIISAVQLGTRHIGDRHNLDKATDVVDEAMAYLRTEIDSLPKELGTKERQIRQ